MAPQWPTPAQCATRVARQFALRGEGTPQLQIKVKVEGPHARQSGAKGLGTPLARRTTSEPPNLSHATVHPHGKDERLPKVTVA
eukprot:2186627-Pyramimonas_sp.AAC.1